MGQLSSSSKELQESGRVSLPASMLTVPPWSFPIIKSLRPSGADELQSCCTCGAASAVQNLPGGLRGIAMHRCQCLLGMLCLFETLAHAHPPIVSAKAFHLTVMYSQAPAFLPISLLESSFSWASKW